MTPTQRASRALLRSLLQRLGTDAITITEGGTITEAGTADTYGNPAGGGLHPVVHVRDPRAWKAIATDGSVGLGRSYFEGWWEADDPTAVVQVLIRNMGAFDDLRNRVPKSLRRLADGARQLAHRSDKAADRDNIHAHYDLGNEFFALFLDETMMYSSALFERPGMSLAEAQRAKLDRLCRLAQLAPGVRVLEIGTGWGGFAIHAAQRYGCHVTTTTISDEQYRYTKEQISELGLQDQINLLDQDFRDLEGTFDAIVSIEMIEAVDWRLYPTFFETCNRLLTKNGRLAMQAITITDQRYDRAKNTTDFIKQHVFPGGCLPSVTALTQSATEHSDLVMVDLFDMGPDYAETLRRWHQTFLAETVALGSAGLELRLQRLWRFYLSYCEAAFLERHVSDVQVLFVRPGWRSERSNAGPTGVRPNQ
jgi:cyclopropane-fatty-acyl-phospholipid synthase